MSKAWFKDLIWDSSQASDWPLAESGRGIFLFWLLCDMLSGCPPGGAYPPPRSMQRSATLVGNFITPLLQTGCFTGGYRQLEQALELGISELFGLEFEL